MTSPQPGQLPQQRLRMRFSKGGPARYIGHLDLARTLERSLNRARIPLAYSLGFTRRPKLSLAAALPLGYTSEAEYADFWLVETRLPEDVLLNFNLRVAPGIEALQVGEVPLKAPSLQQSIVESDYNVLFGNETDVDELQAQVDALLAKDDYLVERVRGKKKKVRQYDLRPLILNLKVINDQEDELRLEMRLVQTPAQTGRPEDVLKALAYDPLDLWVHRTAILLDQNEGSGTDESGS